MLNFVLFLLVCSVVVLQPLLQQLPKVWYPPGEGDHTDRPEASSNTRMFRTVVVYRSRAHSSATVHTLAHGEFVSPVKKPQNLTMTSALALSPGARHCCRR